MPLLPSFNQSQVEGQSRPYDGLSSPSLPPKMQRLFSQLRDTFRKIGAKIRHPNKFSLHNPKYRILRDKNNRFSFNEAVCRDARDLMGKTDNEIMQLLTHVLGPFRSRKELAKDIQRLRADTSIIIRDWEDHYHAIDSQDLRQAMHAWYSRYKPSREERIKLDDRLDEEARTHNERPPFVRAIVESWGMFDSGTPHAGHDSLSSPGSADSSYITANEVEAVQKVLSKSRLLPVVSKGSPKVVVPSEGSIRAECKASVENATENIPTETLNWVDKVHGSVAEPHDRALKSIENLGQR